MASEPYVPPDPRDLAIPAVESPFLETYLADSGLPEETKAAARHYHEQGYLIVDLDAPGFDATCERMIRELAPHYPDVVEGRRIDEGWYFNEDVRTLACLPQILELLRLLYQREPFPFQTLNFDVGTEQPAHSDTIHFHCVPRHYMAGVWIPLEDVDEECGTLFVVPGSHKLPDYDMFDLGLRASKDSYRGYEELVARLLDVHGLRPVPVPVRRGQAIFWAANLFHGGSPRRDRSRTRHSQATHYYFDDCLYYMPLESDLFTGKLCLREVIDIRTGAMRPHRYRGRALELSEYRHVFQYPRPLPRWVSDARELVRDEPRATDPARRIEDLEDEVARLRNENRLKSERITQLEGATPYRLGKALRNAWRNRRTAPHG